MNCDDFNEVADRLVELAYGELPAEERERLEAHARGCADCGGKLEDLRATLRRLDDAHGGEEVRVDTCRVLLAATNRAERAVRRWRVACAAASAMVVLALGLAVLTRGPSPSRMTDATFAEALDAIRDHNERLEALEELTRLVAVEIDSERERSARALVALQGRLHELEGQSRARWRRLDDDVRAVYHIASREHIAARE